MCFMVTSVLYFSISKAKFGKSKLMILLADIRKTHIFQTLLNSVIFYSNNKTAAAAAKSLQSCPTVRPHRRQPTRLRRPWDSPGKNTGVGCHFLLQFMKVKSESEVAQSCPTLSDLMDCSLPGSSIHGIFQAVVLEWVAIAFSIIRLTCLYYLMSWPGYKGRRIQGKKIQ